MLIGGSTTIDNDQVQLDSIIDEWRSTNTYEQRVNNLRDGSGTSDGANGSVFLSDVVVDDAQTDELRGNDGSDFFAWVRVSEALDVSVIEFVDVQA